MNQSFSKLGILNLGLKLGIWDFSNLNQLFWNWESWIWDLTNLKSGIRPLWISESEICIPSLPPLISVYQLTISSVVGWFAHKMILIVSFVVQVLETILLWQSLSLQSYPRTYTHCYQGTLTCDKATIKTDRHQQKYPKST